MLTRVLAMVLLAAACSGGTAATTSARPGTTAPRPVAATTKQTQDYVIGSCASPPITFSALCEVYDLLENWHVDRPLDDRVLAAAAVDGINSFETDLRADRPRTLQCAAPTPAFEDVCVALAQRVLDSELPVAAALEAAVVSMATIAGDPFSHYLPKDQVGAFTPSGVVGGVGIILDVTDAVGSRCVVIAPSCPLEIVAVLEDNPGAHSGLQVGDRIVAVDGEPVEGASLAATATAIAGDESGVVQLTIERSGEESVVLVTREELTFPTVIADIPFDDVGYLKIPDFGGRIPRLVDDALAELAPFRVGTLVVDLRDNPGGLVGAVMAVADQFMDDGVVMISEAPDELLEYESFDGGQATAPRIVVVVNGGSASAAEVLAGALREQRGATIVGSPTFGKDAIQIPFPLRSGGEMTVVVARWTTPNGASVGEDGLTPDIELELSADLTTEDLVGRVLAATS